MSVARITNCRLEVDTYQHLINTCHANKNYSDLHRHIKSWSTAVKKYNESVSYFLGER